MRYQGIQIMKKRFVIALIFLPLLGHAQDFREEMEKDFTRYVDHIIAKEFNQAMDYTYEKFFELIPRARMVEMMTATFNDPEVEYELFRARITETGQPVRLNHEFFAILRYNSIIRMKFLQGESPETQEEFEQRMQLTRLSLEELFGPENVFYEAETGFWRLTSLKNVCAVSRDGISDWRFVVLEKEQLPYLKQILPEQILDKVE